MHLHSGSPHIKEVKATMALCRTVAATAIGFVWMQQVSAEPKIFVSSQSEAPGTALFNATNVLRFRIDLSESDWNALKQSNRTYVAGSFAHGTNVLRNVGVRLKGKSTFQGLDQKPSLSIKFNQFGDQRYLGLTKILLNNSTTDASSLREYVANELFRAAGVPAPRVTHARVELNGRDLGLYVVVEGITKGFLREHFTRDSGNVYEGEFRDINRSLGQEGGDEAGQLDLGALRGTAKVSDAAERWRRLQDVLDVERFISFAVIEQMTGQNDGYLNQANNYRIYHDPESERLVFFPHGLDGTFTDANFTIRPPVERIVARAVLQTHEGRRAYRRTAEELFSRVFVAGRLVEQVNRAADRLRNAAINGEEVSQISLSCSNLCEIIHERAASISSQIANPELELVQFNENGIATVTGWNGSVFGKAKLEEKVVDGKSIWHVQSHEDFSGASYRTRVLLDPGKYVLSGEMRIAKVEPSKSAHLRAEALFRPFGKAGGVVLYAIGEPKRDFLTGDADWKEYQYPFEINYGPQEIELAWEFIESKGEAWVRTDSFRLIRR